MSATDLDTSTRSRAERPRFYSVVFVNDDFTPMEFVVLVLQKVFGLSAEDAVASTLEIHNKGRAAVGSFTREVAETKAAQAMSVAKEHEFPLSCGPEPI